jgi:hypothetical protein
MKVVTNNIELAAEIDVVRDLAAARSSPKRGLVVRRPLRN